MHQHFLLSGACLAQGHAGFVPQGPSLLESCPFLWQIGTLAPMALPAAQPQLRQAVPPWRICFPAQIAGPGATSVSGLRGNARATPGQACWEDSLHEQVKNRESGCRSTTQACPPGEPRSSPEGHALAV
jgi:hypothetical protein